MIDPNDFVSDERSPQEQRLFFVCLTFAGFLNQIIQYPDQLDEQIMRAVVQAMRQSVDGTDFSNSPREEEGAVMKTAIADCEELVDHLLGIHPDALTEPGQQFFTFMPQRYFVGESIDSDLVMQLSVMVQCLFLFAAQARALSITDGVLSAQDKRDLKEWCLVGVEDLRLAHLPPERSLAIGKDAVISVRMLLSNIL